MTEYIDHILSRISLIHLGLLTFFGIALLVGTISGKIFQKMRIPSVVGYIIVGIIIGQTGLKIVDKHMLEMLQPFNYFALGLIGFMIGGELKKNTLLKYGKQFLYILISEGVIAFIVVALLVTSLGMLFLPNIKIACSLGLLLGAIASATAPAATTDVLWENRSRGPLTSIIMGIVALDDGLSLFLFAVASSIAMSLMGDVHTGFLGMILFPLYEVGGAILLGVVAGWVHGIILKKWVDEEKILALSIGTVLLVLGVALAIKVDILLGAMALGAMMINYFPRKSKEVFSLVGKFTPPIYVLFFVLFGAKLDLNHMTIFMLLLAGAYLLGRTGGKMFGAYFGARMSGASKNIQRYLPLCLFSQAGVAIGLSILAGQRFPGELGNAIVVVITTTTFIVQIIGPICTKWGITKAGEVGLNVTEEDIIRMSKAEDVMDKDVPIIYENMFLAEILKVLGKSNNLYYPVVNHDKNLLGIISIDNVKNTFMATGLDSFLLAHDLMEPVVTQVAQDTSLKEVNEMLHNYSVEFIPVVDGSNVVIGMVEARAIHRYLAEKIIENQRLAEIPV
ncbi:MAG: cation:proton antiporter [Candidatus Ancaeobacter aquaticus]|nr:cation:proton antiporter [Candidatus Ancaeobacter aquaticus]